MVVDNHHVNQAQDVDSNGKAAAGAAGHAVLAVRRPADHGTRTAEATMSTHTEPKKPSVSIPVGVYVDNNDLDSSDSERGAGARRRRTMMTIRKPVTTI